MKVYYDDLTKGFYQDDIHKRIPKTAIEIPDALRWKLLTDSSAGAEIVVIDGVVTTRVVPADLENIERCWRDEQLLKADLELYKVQDADPKAVGTVAEWREYRKLLRAWPENSNFPNKSYRPLMPGNRE